ncbi:MAG: YdeI/OmpD-associated family protein [Chthonomonadales bacterium]
MNADKIELSAMIERKAPNLPRFMVIPAELLMGWNLAGTTTVECSINGVAIGQRSIKKWDENRWFIELSEPLCKKAGVDTGDQVELVIRLAEELMPEELVALIATNQHAKAVWDSLTKSQQRMISEHVHAAAGASTRARRANKALLGT